MTHARPTPRPRARGAALAIALALSGLPAGAQDSEPEAPSLMQRGAELFFEGLRQEMQPKLEELQAWADKFGPSMQSFIEEMGPAFMDMVDEVKDWTRYYPPEMLPNGDIIIRKRPEPETEPEPEAPGTGGAGTDL
jgi:hypothetical protein